MLKKKVNALVFTGKLNTWYKNKKNILIGSWCLLNLKQKNKIKSFNFILSDRETKNLEYYNKKNIIKFEYYYSRLLEDCIKNLTNYYNVNWNKRSWEIFLGP